MGTRMIVIADLRDIPVRFSHLKAYGRSAMHGYHARLNDMKPTSAMQRGTAVDALIFKTRKVMGYPGAQRRGKEYELFCADNPDTEILTMAEYEKAIAIAQAVLNCDYARPWLDGVSQETLYFDYMGLRSRSTTDVRGNGFVCDLKTTVDASDYRFPWQARRMGYPVQLVMQGIAAELNGFPTSRYINLAVEASAPFPVTIFELTPRSIDKASRTLMLWYERLKTAESSMVFPAYSQAIVPLDEPEDEPELIYGSEDEAACPTIKPCSIKTISVRGHYLTARTW